MWRTWRRVICRRGSSGVGSSRGPQASKGSGASRLRRPWLTAMPMRVTAMLFAVDQVRVRVVRSTPGA
jgi:hypothetical protein